jgi:hypothetical protein
MNRLYRLAQLTACLLLVIVLSSKAQTRNYYTNRAITGQTEDTQGMNYLLLHKIYTGTPLADNFVMGKITGIRGSTVSWNRKWTVEVNTASAYSQNRGSIISYNEPAWLVTLTYNGEGYLAVTIANASALFNFSFTGYAQNETLMLVHDENVSDVAAFSTMDPVVIQGNFGIGAGTPRTYLDILPAVPNTTTATLASCLRGIQ